MILPSTSQMYEIEESYIESGVSSYELVQLAAKECFRTIRSKILNYTRKKITVLCGPGNNGADGFAISSYFFDSGYDVTIISIKSDKLSDNNSKVRSKIPEKILHMELDATSDLVSIESQLKSADIIIDALLGIGQKGKLKGSIQALLTCISKASIDNKVIAIDIPTGFNCDTGESLYLNPIRYLATISIQFHKRGLFQGTLKACCGTIYLVDIKIPRSSLVEFKLENSIFYEDLIKLILKRDTNCHKGSFGKCYVFGTNSECIGASTLAALSAHKTGAPLVTKIYRKTNLQSGLGLSVILTLEENAFFKKKITSNDIIVIGPGFGTDRSSTSCFLRVLRLAIKINCYLIIDADALTILAKQSDSCKLTAKTILTPHPKEASVLLGSSVQDIESNRYNSIQDLYEKYHCNIILKGSSTIVYSEDRGQVLTNGSSMMATGGSGDVLSGIIAGCISQIGNLKFNVDFISSAVYLHNEAGASFKRPQTALDIIDNIPVIFDRIINL